MPQNLNIQVPSNTWTLLTDTNISACTFQLNMSASVPILIAGTVGAVAPSSTDGAIEYLPGFGELNVTLSELFPGVVGANRLYAFSTRETSIFVSHA